MLKKTIIDKLISEAKLGKVDISYVKSLVNRDLEFDEAMSYITLVNTNYPYENFYVFENVVRALNGVSPKVELLEGTKPRWIWKACEIISKLRPKMELSIEVKEYIKFVFFDYGMYFLPKLAITDPHYTKLMENINSTLSSGKPLDDDESFLNRQSLLYLSIIEEINE